MIRRTDRPLRIVRVSFQTTRFSAQHLIDAYTWLVPIVRRTRVASKGSQAGPSHAKAMAAKRRRGEE